MVCHVVTLHMYRYIVELNDNSRLINNAYNNRNDMAYQTAS